MDDVNKVYKVFLYENDNLKNLFRGIEGSRNIEYDKWLKAKKVMSVDGSGQKPYLTGIHCLKNKKDAIEYLKNFRTEKNRVVVECYASGLRKKPTNEKVSLADFIYVPSVEEIKIVA